MWVANRRRRRWLSTVTVFEPRMDSGVAPMTPKSNTQSLDHATTFPGDS